MEGHLGGCHDIQAPVHIHVSVCPECLHHGLLVCLCMIHALNDMGTPCKRFLQVSMGLLSRGAQVPPVVGAHIAMALPAVLRVHQDVPILGVMHVQHRLQHLVLHTDQAHGMVHGRLSFTGHNSHRIPHKAQALIQDQPVVRAGLRIGLPCHGKAFPGHVLMCDDTLNARDLNRYRAVDLSDQRMGIGASEHLYHQAVLQRQVICKHRLSCHKRLGIFFNHRRAYDTEIPHL